MEYLGDEGGLLGDTCFVAFSPDGKTVSLYDQLYRIESQTKIEPSLKAKAASVLWPSARTARRS